MCAFNAFQGTQPSNTEVRSSAALKNLFNMLVRILSELAKIKKAIISNAISTGARDSGPSRLGMGISSIRRHELGDTTHLIIACDIALSTISIRLALR